MSVGVKLLIVPDVCGVASLDVFRDMQVVVLDKLLMEGVSGDYFRRLRVRAALFAAERKVYEDRRDEYLHRVLSRSELPNGAIVVGTRASDADLMEFEAVYVVKVAEVELRMMGRMVHGDSATMVVESACLLCAAENACNGVLAVTRWHDLPLLLRRQFQLPDVVAPLIQEQDSYDILFGMLSGQDDALVWLERPVCAAVHEPGVVLVAGFDYLTFIAPVWRDAVIRIFGGAPDVADIFRLSWFMIDPNARDRLCYRVDLQGRMVATSRGYSLVAFVKGKLMGMMSPREVAGTWLAGFLSDDELAVDVYQVLAEGPMSGQVVSSESSVIGDGKRLYVPHKYLWAYAAVPGVVGCDLFQDTKELSCADYDVGRRYALSLPFVALYEQVPVDSALATCVVQFVARLHRIVCDESFLRLLYERMRFALISHVGVYDDFVSLMPGYEHLQLLPQDERYRVARECGQCPSFDYMSPYIDMKGDMALSLAAVGARVAFFTGMMKSGYWVNFPPDFATDAYGDWTIRATVGFEPGYCYLVAVRGRYRGAARDKLGAYPLLSRVVDSLPSSWYVPGYCDNIRVSVGAHVITTDGSPTVIHFSDDGPGVPLREYLRLRSCVGWEAYDLPVGAQPACVDQVWFVMAVIAWTVVGCVFVALLVWFIYLKCAGKRSGGGYASGRRY